MMRPNSSWARRWRWGVAAVFTAVTVSAAPTESDLKAVFLFHFTQFVAWPESAFSSPNAPFVIGVIGRDPFGPTLSDVVRGESIGLHPLLVQHVDSLEAARRCQILYVAAGSEGHFAPSSLASEPILTVGDSEAFYRSGGIIQFFTDHSHVRLKVNLAAARADSLTISAKLLRVAEVEGAN
jgi:hypothetical protein